MEIAYYLYFRTMTASGVGLQSIIKGNNCPWQRLYPYMFVWRTVKPPFWIGTLKTKEILMLTPATLKEYKSKHGHVCTTYSQNRQPRAWEQVWTKQQLHTATNSMHRQIKWAGFDFRAVLHSVVRNVIHRICKSQPGPMNGALAWELFSYSGIDL